jgi:segregation and condensation protein B
MNSPAETDEISRRFDEHERQRQRALLEAVLFASPEPVTLGQLARALQESEELVQILLREIMEHFAGPGHGVFVRKTGAGYRLGTQPEHHADLKEILRGLRPRAPLSVPALQTLAIIAYKQPVSAPEIQAIRRVEGAGVLDTLLKRKLIAPAGYKRDGGRALRYKTTDLFLKDFGLPSLKDLPSLENFAEIRLDEGLLQTEESS